MVGGFRGCFCAELIRRDNGLGTISNTELDVLVFTNPDIIFCEEVFSRQQTKRVESCRLMDTSTIRRLLNSLPRGYVILMMYTSQDSVEITSNDCYFPYVKLRMLPLR